jgi:WD40 repeat protein
VDAVNNNDVADHGALITLTVGADNRIAVAGMDGVIKFWTLEEGFLGSVTAAALTYGPEITGAQSADLAFAGDWVIAGDVRGLVTAFTVDGGFQVVGGTDPDVAIATVATHGPDRFAHADVRESGHVFVRSREGGETVGPLTTDLTHVHDLAFLPDGRLLLGGDLGGVYAAFEVRDASDPTRIAASYLVEGGAPIEEVALSADGAVIAGVGSRFLAVFDGALDGGSARMALPEDHLGTSVTVTPDGVVLTAGSEGSVRAWVTGGDDGIRETARLPLVDPVAIRVDASGTLAFAGTRDGMIHVLGCEE